MELIDGINKRNQQTESTNGINKWRIIDELSMVPRPHDKGQKNDAGGHKTH